MPRRVGDNFQTNVFINCPFDDEYKTLLRPMLFTVVRFGFNPRIASERSDSGEQRINKICQLISSSRYAIHDLSRLQSKKKNEFYRLNMAFELGIEYGIRHFSKAGRFRTKRCLILGRKPYDFTKALSDLSGVDIKNHGDDPHVLIRELRNWFMETVALTEIDGPTRIWDDFCEFMADCYERKKSQGFTDEDVRMMAVPELIRLMKVWVSRPTLSST